MVAALLDRSGAAFDVLDVGNPVAHPSREAGACLLIVEARRPTAKKELIDVFECVGADNGIETAVDMAADDRHRAAAGADMEPCGSLAERVSRYQQGMRDQHLQVAARIGDPCAAVLGAKRACAGAHLDFDRIGLPGERERDIPAMTMAVDQLGVNTGLPQTSSRRWCVKSELKLARQKCAGSGMPRSRQILRAR